MQLEIIGVLVLIQIIRLRKMIGLNGTKISCIGLDVNNTRGKSSSTTDYR